jgi:hypothetical protein
VTNTVIECVKCTAQFTDAQVAEIKDSTCPSCGTKDKPKLIGAAALAQALVEEYLEVRPWLLSGTLRVQDLSARQLAGNWLLVYGRKEAVAKARSGSCRMEKLWPGFTALLEKVNAMGQP